MILRCIAAFAASSMLAVGVASSQTMTVPAQQEVLVLPEGQPMLCSLPTGEDAEAIPPDAVARIFRFGKPVTSFMTMWPREILVAFDSSGTPRVLIDEVTNFVGNTLFTGTASVGAVFREGQVLGSISRGTVDTVALKSAVAQGSIEKALATSAEVTRVLSASEQTQAKALAEWLWKRRCPGEPAKVVPPGRTG